MTQDHDTAPDAPDPSTIDPSKLKDAHGRTGQILKQAGLPFEEDEFDGESAREAGLGDTDSGSSGDNDSSSSSSSSSEEE